MLHAAITNCVCHCRLLEILELNFSLWDGRAVLQVSCQMPERMTSIYGPGCRIGIMRVLRNGL
jgi:hypothetical protein